MGGLLGPSGTRTQLAHWLAAAGFADARVRTSGALVYFRVTRAEGTIPESE